MRGRNRGLRDFADIPSMNPLEIENVASVRNENRVFKEREKRRDGESGKGEESGGRGRGGREGDRGARMGKETEGEVVWTRERMSESEQGT
eukprot:1217271-Amorphochlora_amoeboformis.AAC.1